MLLAGCGTALVLAAPWAGAETTSLTVGEAWDVINDPEQAANRKQLATLQLFRVAQGCGPEAGAAKQLLLELAKRSDECGEHARRHLKKLEK